MKDSRITFALKSMSEMSLSNYHRQPLLCPFLWPKQTLFNQLINYFNLLWLLQFSLLSAYLFSPLVKGRYFTEIAFGSANRR